MPVIRVLAVGDNPPSSHAAVRMLSRSPQIEIVGSASSDWNALRGPRRLGPDLVRNVRGPPPSSAPRGILGCLGLYL